MSSRTDKTYLYSIQCCGATWIDVHAGAVSECMTCHSRFEVTDPTRRPEMAVDLTPKSWCAELDSDENNEWYHALSEAWTKVWKLWTWELDHGHSATAELRDMCAEITEAMDDLTDVMGG